MLNEIKSVPRLDPEMEKFMKDFVDSMTLENMRKNVKVRMFDKENPRVMTRLEAGVPMREVCGDFVLFAVYEVEAPDGEGMLSASIPKGVIEEAFESDDELFDIAIANMGDPMMTPISIPYVEDGAVNLLEDMDEPMDVLSVLSFGNGLNGSAAIAVDGILEKVADRVGGSYWMIPSSIHEMLIAPDDERFDETQMNEMLERGNEMTCGPQEVLSWKVRYYDAEKKTLNVK